MSEKTDEGDVLKYRNSVACILYSMTEKEKIKKTPKDVKIDRFLRYDAKIYELDAEALDCLLSVNISNLEASKTEVLKFLDVFKIDLRQLEFSENVMNLAEITVFKIFPEGKRAYVPIAQAAGIEMDFNRLSIFGNISPSCNTIERQLKYLKEGLWREPDLVQPFDDRNYFSYHDIGEKPTSNVYIHLIKD